MARFVVTGGAGRLGRSVVVTLAAAGHDVVSIDLDSSANLPAEQVVVDLRDAEPTATAFAAIAPDAVVHLAALAVPFSRPEAEIFSINTSIMYTVLDATVAAGAGALLVASSPTVVGYGNPQGWVPDYLPIDEDHPLAPWHGYAVSKLAMEEIVAMAVRRFGDAVRFGVFRPCYVIAPEEWHDAPTQQGHTVRERLARPELAAVALFNYLDARDAGDFVLAWFAGAHRLPNGGTFFVGAPDALTHGPLAEVLPRHLPGLDGRAAALTGTRPAFDCSRAERLLGWTATRTWRTELDTPPEGR